MRFLPMGKVIHQNLETRYLNLMRMFQKMKYNEFTGYTTFRFFDLYAILIWLAGDITLYLKDSNGQLELSERDFANLEIQLEKHHALLDFYELELRTALKIQRTLQGKYLTVQRDLIDIETLIDEFKTIPKVCFRIHNKQTIIMIWTKRGKIYEVFTGGYEFQINNKIPELPTSTKVDIIELLI